MYLFFKKVPASSRWLPSRGAMSTLKRIRVGTPDEADDDDIVASAPAAPSAIGGSDLPARYNAMLRAPPSEILPWLFLGSSANAANKKQLQELGIKYILNLKESNFSSPPQVRLATSRHFLIWLTSFAPNFHITGN